MTFEALHILKMAHQYEATDLGGSAMALLSAICMEWDTRRCEGWVSWRAEQACERSGIDRKTLPRVRARLVEAGWLEVQAGQHRKRAAQYRPRLPDDLEAVPRGTVAGKFPEHSPNEGRTFPEHSPNIPRSCHEDETNPPRTRHEHGAVIDPSPTQSQPTPPPSPERDAVQDPRSGARPAATATARGLSSKIKSIDVGRVREAIERASLPDLVAAYGANARRGPEWARDADGLQLGVIACVFEWCRRERRPIREPSGLRQALSEWRDLDRDRKRVMADELADALDLVNGSRAGVGL